ncbi:hypothetical protein FB451DRAFT_1391047 [Mycena latifolia]|nr:hypothetical protein FB451DRAFT_1391047 [Mycena latifolia]
MPPSRAGLRPRDAGKPEVRSTYAYGIVWNKSGTTILSLSLCPTPRPPLQLPLTHALSDLLTFALGLPLALVCALMLVVVWEHMQAEP